MHAARATLLASRNLFTYCCSLHSTYPAARCLYGHCRPTCSQVLYVDLCGRTFPVTCMGTRLGVSGFCSVGGYIGLAAYVCRGLVTVTPSFTTPAVTSSPKYSRSVADSAHFHEIAADGAASSGWKDSLYTVHIQRRRSVLLHAAMRDLTIANSFSLHHCVLVVFYFYL